MPEMPRRAFLHTTITAALVAGSSRLLLGAGAAQAAAASPWTAHWIWHSSSSANQWVSFRRSFSLSAAPSTALTRIAVDSKYWLWVNGTLVTFEGGLKRGPNPAGTYYDQIDLAPHLVSGPNTIALLVWYFGTPQHCYNSKGVQKGPFSHHSSGHGGLLFQSDITVAGTTTTVISDTNWKYLLHPGYSNDTSGKQPNYRLPESNISYDARKATTMANWQSAGYSDTAWSTPTDSGAQGGTDLPWGDLVPRPTPAFRYSGLSSYTNDASLPSKGSDTAPIIATLPSNLQVTPYLKVKAPAGAVIGIQTDHYTDGGENNVRSTYICSGDRNGEEFESLGWMSGTAVQYTIPSTVTIVSLRYRASGYDTSVAGSFTCSSAFLNLLWQKAANTMYLNMRDSYMDCPTRERAQWWGDAVSEMKEGFYTFDTNAHALGKKAIAELVAWANRDGALHAPIPAGVTTGELPTQMLASVWHLWTYYLYTGDASAVTGAYRAVKTYLKLWTLDSQGLVNHRKGGWDWEDWGDNIDARVLDNCWYYLALGTAINLANLTRNTADVAGWQTKQASIKANFDKYLWDTGRAAYRSPGYTGDTDDRANALAVVAGLAAPANYPAITDVLNKHYNSSPYTEFYVLEALYLMGNPGAAEVRMHARYGDQVSSSGYTLWENWNLSQGTDNHAWNGGPLYALSAYAAGVRPTKPGYATFQVTPQLGGLTSINATVPSIKGPISVTLNRPAPNKLTMSVTVPSGTTATLGVPLLGMTAATITSGGTTLYTAGKASGNSVTGLSYSGADTDYVYFTAKPGTWGFTVTGTGGTTAHNLALNAPVTSNSTLENSNWGAAKLTDGVTTSISGAKGYSSHIFHSADVSANPVWVEVDLGADQTVDAVRLFPRTDTLTATGTTANFPVDFTIQTSTSANPSSYTTVRTVTGQANPSGAVQTYGFAPTAARHIRIHATTLGTPARDEPTYYRLQLAELQVPPTSEVLRAAESYETSVWGCQFGIDGITTSTPTSKGYSSFAHSAADVRSTPLWVVLDLGADRAVSSVTLYPRTDTLTATATTANFPVDFTIQTMTQSGTTFTTTKTITGQANPNGAPQTYTFPATTARYLRLLVTTLGTPAKDEKTSKYRYRLQFAEIAVS